MVIDVSERPVAYISFVDAAGSSETSVTVYRITEVE
jgi:hypothetical protein